MQNKLAELLSKQARLQHELGYGISEMSSQERVAYIKEYAQHLDGETFEMLRELPYFKSWKKYPDSEEAQNLMFAAARKEWIDALHFFLNITIALGFNADELFEMFCDKNGINYERQEDTENYKPCVGGQQ